MRAALIGLLCCACSGGSPPEPPSGRSVTPPPGQSTPPPAPAPVADAARPGQPVDAGGPAFSVEPALDLQRAPGDGPDLVFTSGGKLPAPAPEYAIFRVTASPAMAGDRPKTARARLTATDLAEGVKIDGQAATRIDGLDGFITQARGRHERTPVTLYQVVLFAAAHTYVLQGRASTERWNWYRAAFEKMAASFHRE